MHGSDVDQKGVYECNMLCQIVQAGGRATNEHIRFTSDKGEFIFVTCKDSAMFCLLMRKA